VRPLIELIKAAGQTVVLASSGKQEEVDHHVKTAGIGDLVDAVTTADDAERSKPEPDIFAAALQRIAPLGPRRRSSWATRRTTPKPPPRSG
jgi:beta-phosphoglucomutase-like phosphatase (HAD superfamily)